MNAKKTSIAPSAIFFNSNFLAHSPELSLGNVTFKKDFNLSWLPVSRYLCYTSWLTFSNWNKFIWVRKRNWKTSSRQFLTVLWSKNVFCPIGQGNRNHATSSTEGAWSALFCNLFKSGLDNYVVKRSKCPLLEEVSWSRVPIPITVLKFS